MAVILIAKNGRPFEALADRLRRAGFVVASTTSAREATALGTRGAFDMIVIHLRPSDILGLPDLQGLIHAHSRTRLILVAELTPLPEAVANTSPERELADALVSVHPITEIASAFFAKKVGPSGTGAVSDATDERQWMHRWATIVAVVIRSKRDSPTMKAWAKCAAKSSSSLSNICRRANVSAKASLLLGRLCRAIAVRNATTCKIPDCLDITDLRTLKKIMRQAGINTGDCEQLPRSIEHFLATQNLIANRDIIDELKSILELAEVTHGQ